MSATTLYYGGSNGSGYNCSGMASTGAVQGCELAAHDKWLTDDLNGLNSNPIILPLTSLSCPSAALTDAGPSGGYADVFNVTYYRGAVNAGGFWIPIYYKFCDGPKVDNYHLTAKPICPDHSKQTSTADTTCTCDDTFMPAGTTCIPETYAITLSGLGVDVMPTKTLKAYAEVTSNATGSPKSGAQVTLILTVVPDDGDPVLASNVGSISPNGGATEADGRLNFVFTAPTAGGIHTVHAGCTNCTNVAEGTIKVPGCSVNDLPPITDPEVQTFEDNPDLSDETRLTAAMKEALRLLRAAVTAAGSSSSVGSAYRPPAYNQHLIDVWKKWMDELKKNTEPACAALKTKIQNHFKTHKLKESQSPVPGSRHTRGEAVDVTISPDIPNIDTLARTCCNLRRPVPVDDPVHFQFP